MTLVEFLEPLAGGSRQRLCLAVMYYLIRYEGKEAVTVEEVRDGLRRARISGWRRVNVADVLAKSGAYVDSPSARGNKRLWALTNTGQEHIREVLGLPPAEAEVEHNVADLSAKARALSDQTIRSFVEEGILCLQIGALRAAVVFLWSGAIRIVHTRLLTRHQRDLDRALRKHDPKVRKVTRLDHFAYVTDKTVLLAAEEVGILDKGERTTLEEALNLRNRCGHPTKYGPGASRVSGFVEDLISVVFH